MERHVEISYDGEFSKFIVHDETNSTFTVGDVFAFDFERFVQTSIIVPNVWKVWIRNWAAIPLELFGIVVENLMARGILVKGTMHSEHKGTFAIWNLSEPLYTLCQDKYVGGALDGMPINPYACFHMRQSYSHKISVNRFDVYTPLMRKSTNSKNEIYVIVYAGETTHTPSTTNVGPGDISNCDVNEQIRTYEKIVSAGQGSLLQVKTESYEVTKLFLPVEKQFVRQFFQLADGGKLPNQGEPRPLHIGQQNDGARLPAQESKE